MGQAAVHQPAGAQLTVPYILPSPPPIIEGAALQDLLQEWVSGVTGLSGALVRPRWQAEPPNIPPAATVWAAIGIQNRAADTFPYLAHDDENFSQLQRNEVLDVMTSWYDTGIDGQADVMMALFRDGTAIPQNLEVIGASGLMLRGIGDAIAVPPLFKTRWLYRVDLPVQMIRQVDRTYAILSVASARGTLITDSPTNQTRAIDATNP